MESNKTLCEDNQQIQRTCSTMLLTKRVAGSMLYQLYLTREPSAI